MNVRRIVPAVLFLLVVPQYLQSQVTYLAGPVGITPVKISALPAFVAAGAKMTVSCNTATDTDIKRCPDRPDENVPDPVTHTWSGGSFNPSVGPQVEWTAPASAGPATFTVTASDSPLAKDTNQTDSATVTVVKVDKVQYNDPDDGYKNVSGILYVMKGTTVTFKAIKDPADANWPDEKPAWSGTSGATGTGETISVTFNTLSSSLTDFKTVIAECGNTVTVNVIVYSLGRFHIPEDNFTGRALTTYGVRELMDIGFTTNPAGITAAQIGGLKWSQPAGNGDLTDNGDGTGTYRCRVIADSVTLRLTIQSGLSKGKYVEMGLSVIAPSGTRMTRFNTNVWHKQNMASSGIALYYWLEPKTSSFKNVNFGESSCAATNVAGFYLANPPFHKENTFGSIMWGNVATGCRVSAEDHAGSAVPAWPGGGTYKWPIKTQYIHAGARYDFGGLSIHTATHQANGDSEISKAGLSGSATLGSVTVQFGCGHYIWK